VDSVRKQKVYNLLKGIETGDPESVKIVNEAKYIQHNPQTHEGGEGLAALFSRISKTSPKVEIVRLFEDGDFIFVHTIYDFSTVRIGFEVFRYEGDKVVEHWDNIQPRLGEMVGGTIKAQNHDQTCLNKMKIKTFVKRVLVEKKYLDFFYYVNKDKYVEHSSLMNLSEKVEAMDYQKTHRILAEGDFVLVVNEGENNGIHSSFYDLFRVESGMIVEHWDTIEKVPPKSEWKNNNGKF
jgi:predicted SnoaL-like aldol condensation-catalyzing enzyme